MKYSTEQKRRSRLQGHRKRRRVPKALISTPIEKVDFFEYKLLKQYQSMGDVLDSFRTYGTRGALNVSTSNVAPMNGMNGHRWLTEDNT